MDQLTKLCCVHKFPSLYIDILFSINIVVDDMKIMNIYWYCNFDFLGILNMS